MSKLKTGIMVFVSMAGIALLVACPANPQPEVAVDIDVARTLPLAQRLDLYQRIYDPPGHRTDSSLSFALESAGDVGFRAAVNSMTSVHDFYGTIWIGKSIDWFGALNHCEPPLN